MPMMKASAALLTRVAELTLKELNRNDLYVMPSSPQLGLTDAHMALLQQEAADRLDDPVSVTKFVELSRIVNRIQTQPGILSLPEAGFSLAEVFEVLRKNVGFFPVPLSADEQRKYDQAMALCYTEYPFKTPAYEEFCILRIEVEKQDAALLAMQVQLNQAQTDEEKAALQAEIDTLQALLKEQQEILEALDRSYNFRAAEEIRDRAERIIDAIPESVEKTLDIIETKDIEDPASGVTHLACSFFPSLLAENSWAPLTINQEQIAGMESGQATATGQANTVDASQIESIELSVQTLRCDRPWFWEALFDNCNWDWKVPSKPISSGDAEWKADDFIPAYVYALIFARDLTIKLRRPDPQQPVDMTTLRLNLATDLLMHSVAAKPLVLPNLGAAIFARPAGGARATPALRRSPLEELRLVTRPTDPIHVLDPGRVVVRPWDNQWFEKIQDLKIIRTRAAAGQVVDARGNGIYQASVALKGNSGERRASTGPDGKFVFPGITDGNYHIHVVRDGFLPADATLTVPQSGSMTIRMNNASPCQVTVRLQLENGQPFGGSAKVLIKNGNSQRLESMDGRSPAVYALPPGDFTISVTSSEAERISPPSASVRIVAGCADQPTLTFVVSPAFVFQYPEVRLLGIVCRKVPRSPNPQR